MAAFYCATDSATPLPIRATLMGALAYFILPIDAIPDILLVLGYTDDAAIIDRGLRRGPDAHHRSASREGARVAAQGPGFFPA